MNIDIILYYIVLRELCIDLDKNSGVFPVPNYPVTPFFRKFLKIRWETERMRVFSHS